MYIVVFIIVIFIIVCIIGSKTEKQETIPVKSGRSKLQEFENHRTKKIQKIRSSFKAQAYLGGSTFHEGVRVITCKRKLL